jgi:hypothetical protein
MGLDLEVGPKCDKTLGTILFEILCRHLLFCPAGVGAQGTDLLLAFV